MGNRSIPQSGLSILALKISARKDQLVDPYLFISLSIELSVEQKVCTKSVLLVRV